MIPDELQNFLGKLENESVKHKKDGYLLEKQAAKWGLWQAIAVMVTTAIYNITVISIGYSLDNGLFGLCSIYGIFLFCQEGVMGMFGALGKRKALQASTTKLEIEGL